MAGSGSLKRNLGLWSIVGLGLGYMTPTVVFDTFGIVSGITAGHVPSAYILALAGILFTMYSWWADVVREAHAGDHTPIVQLHFRYGMILFIASEVMFFVAWFWAFFDASLFPGEVAQYARNEYTGGIWPPKGLEVLDPFYLPLYNTIILLLSGTTVTWAHHALIHDQRGGAKKGLWGLIGVGERDGVAEVAAEHLPGPVGEAGADDAGEQVRVRQGRDHGVVGGGDDDVVVDELVAGAAQPQQVGVEFVAAAFGRLVDDEDFEPGARILPVAQFGALVLGELLIDRVGHRRAAQTVDRLGDHVVGFVELPVGEEFGDLLDVALAGFGEGDAAGSRFD